MHLRMMLAKQPLNFSIFQVINFNFHNSHYRTLWCLTLHSPEFWERSE